MFLTDVFRRVMRRSSLPRRRHSLGKPARPERARHARLELESLEDRLVPSGEVLFYNQASGVVVTGNVDAAGTFTQQQTVGGVGPFTKIAGIGGGEVLLYFDRPSYKSFAETANVDAAGTFTHQQWFDAFTKGWQSIVGVGGGEVMFYNDDVRLGVTGNVDAAGTFTHQQWFDSPASPGFGWGPDPLVGIGGGEVLFHDTVEGVTGNVDAAGTFTPQQRLGAFSAWTHVVAVGGGELLFYNKYTGAAVTANVDAAGTYTNQQTFGTISPGWDYVVGVGGGEVLFYGPVYGFLLTGNVDAAGTFRRQQRFDGFPGGWTHIVGIDPFEGGGGFGGIGGGGNGAGHPSVPGNLLAFLDLGSGPSVPSDKAVLSNRDAHPTPAREGTSGWAAEALFGGPPFQKAGVEEFQPGIQHAHASTPRQGFLDERALAVWFGLEEDHVPW